jgi:hypothetical protein
MCQSLVSSCPGTNASSPAPQPRSATGLMRGENPGYVVNVRVQETPLRACVTTQLSPTLMLRPNFGQRSRRLRAGGGILLTKDTDGPCRIVRSHREHRRIGLGWHCPLYFTDWCSRNRGCSDYTSRERDEAIVDLSELRGRGGEFKSWPRFHPA